MNVEIKQVAPAEYELELTAEASDLAPQINQKLKTESQKVALKGFRPGKVPPALVKKMFGSTIALDVVDKLVQEIYEEEVIDNPEYDVLGRPMITRLDYDPVAMGDLRAVIRFAVRPAIEVKDVSDVKVERVNKEITDHDVEHEIEHLRMHASELETDPEASATERHFVVADVQLLDPETGGAVIGQKDEDVVLALNSDQLPKKLKNALLGTKAGDSLRVDLPLGGDGDDEDEEPKSLLVLPGQDAPAPKAEKATQPYQITVKDVRTRVLPEVDEAFIRKVTRDQVSDEATFRQQLREQMERDWENRARQLFENDVQEALLARHDITVPEPFIETYLDSLVDEVRRQNDDKLPEHFDMDRFKQANRADAERTLAWILLRDQIIENETIEVTDADVEAHLNEMIGDDTEISPDVLRAYYERAGILPQLQQRLLDQKVYDALAQKMNVEEIDWETYKQRHEAEEETEAAE